MSGKLALRRWSVGGPRVALEVSGHLREACARADGRPALAKAVAECRRFAHCDIFLHTWSTLNAATAVWSDVSDFDDRLSGGVPALAFPFELDAFQKRAVVHLEAGEDVFVSHQLVRSRLTKPKCAPDR